MPSFRQKVVGFLRQLSNPGENSNRAFDQENKPTSTSNCFIQRYLSGKEIIRDEPKILHGRTYTELPPRSLGVVSKVILCAMTGPNGGLTTVNSKQRHLSISDPDVQFIDETLPSSASVSPKPSPVSLPIASDTATTNNNNKAISSGVDQMISEVSTLSVESSSSVIAVEKSEQLNSVQILIENNLPSLDSNSNISECPAPDLPSKTLTTSSNIINNTIKLDFHHNSISNDSNNINNKNLGCVFAPPSTECDGSNNNYNSNNNDKTSRISTQSASSSPIKKNDIQKSNDNQPMSNVYQRTSNQGGDVAGVNANDWGQGCGRAFGCSTSLYERHPLTGVPAGEPIADCFAVVSRRNSAILCLADGVNWGVKASLAARAAIHGCMDYLNKAIYSCSTSSTTEVFHALLRSFHAAHNLILQEDGLLTTLTAVVVLPLVASDCYIACACNVGDSLAYVYSPRHGVREITQGSHDVHRMRDMRDALGALGPVDGLNPELGNLTCSMTELELGDIVFLTSDGVSDNLDPVVGKFTGLPAVEAHQRHRLTLLRTEDLLNNGVSGHGPPCSSAKELVSLLIDFVTRLTAAKRRMLEDVELYTDEDGGGPRSRGKQRTRRKDVCAKLAMIPGKLDHATVVAYTVGEFTETET